MKLEKMVASVLPLHKRVLRPKHRKGTLIYQESADGFYPSGQGRKQMAGDFYEVLSWIIFGGELNDRRHYIDFRNRKPVIRQIKPDLVDDENKKVGEVKSNYSGKTCNFTRTQVMGYKALQYDQSDYEFTIHIYRHSVRGIESIDRGYDELLDELSDKTRYSVVIPLSIFLSFMDSNYENGNLSYLYHNEESRWDETPCIRSSTTTGFFMEPEKNLTLLGLDTNRFEIQRVLSPSNVRIGDKRIKQFPIVRILDLDYQNWVKDFMKKYEIEMERPDVELDELPLLSESKVEGVPFD